MTPFVNKAAHPEGLPLEEDEIVKALCNLLTKGFLRDFAAVLDPVKPLVVQPAPSTRADILSRYGVGQNRRTR